MQKILLTFVGNRDPFPPQSPEAGEAGEADSGPILSLLHAREFSRVILFCTGGAYIERGRSVEEAAKGLGITASFKFVTIELDSPIDYVEIYGKLSAALETVRLSFDHHGGGLSVLLDPGTPQMQTAWFLLVASGTLEAQLLQGIPARFAGGAYKVRQVDVSPERFPGISISSSPARSAAALAGDTDVQTTDERWTRGWQTNIVGTSVGLRTVMEQASRAARYGVLVMIRGETGTGKELIARLIHQESDRSERAFVAVNCAAISPALTESELFGHEKGAFTGADRDRLGQFRAADGGTVLLDEVGDLSLEAQAKLLRVIETQKVTPVGADKEIQVDVRIIAATNRDLEEQIEAGEFRRDLYERLAGITLEIPPLRERQEDIALLLRHFIDLWNTKYDERKGLSDEVMHYLLQYPWPGNVRELQNVVSSMLAMGQSDKIGPELLPRPVTRHFSTRPVESVLSTDLPDDGVDLKAVMYNVEKEYYAQALERTGGNAEQAAKLLGVQGAAFRKAARERLGIDWRESREDPGA